MECVCLKSGEDRAVEVEMICAMMDEGVDVLMQSYSMTEAFVSARSDKVKYSIDLRVFWVSVWRRLGAVVGGMQISGCDSAASQEGRCDGLANRDSTKRKMRR